MRPLLLGLAVMLLARGVAWHPAAQPDPDPLSLLSPFVELSRGERARLAEGEIVVKSLESRDPSQLAIFLGTRIAITPERFVAKIRDSARLWRGPSTPRTGSFSSPVRPSDVAELTLPDGDLEALRACEPGACGVKLTAAEIARVREAVGRGGAAWRAAAQQAFRAVVVSRIDAYRRGGLPALEPFHDQRDPVAPQAAFAEVLAQARVIAARAPALAEYAERYPRLPLPEGGEDLLYWIESTETPRRTTQAWHVMIERRAGGLPEVIVVSRQVFATHYVNGSIAMTLLARDGTGRRYLLYLNRSTIDGLEGFLSGLRRFFVERRVRSGAGALFERLRMRLDEP